MLDGIDAAIAGDHEMSSAAIFTALVLPFWYEPLIAARPGDVFGLISEALGPLVDDVRVTRRDSERMRLLMTMLRRIAAAAARGSQAELSGGADLIGEAQLLHHLMQRALGHAPTAPLPVATEPVDGEPELTEHDADGDGEPTVLGEDGLPRKRRRRLRGGARARRPRADGAA